MALRHGPGCLTVLRAWHAVGLVAVLPCNLLALRASVLHLRLLL